MKTKPPVKSSSVRSSPYYLRLIRLAAILTLTVAGLSVIGCIVKLATYHWSGPAEFRYVGSVIAYAVGTPVMIGGGLALGLLLTRRSALRLNERIVIGGTYGLSAVLLYEFGFGTVLRLAFMYVGVSPLLTALGPLLALAVTAVIAYAASRMKRGASLRMALFVGLLLISQLSIIGETAAVAAGAVPGAVFTGIPVWMIVLGLFTVPLISAAILYWPIKPIGRLARVFYAAYFAVLIYRFMLSLFDFITSPRADIATVVDYVAVIFGTVLLAGLVILLVRLRKSS